MTIQIKKYKPTEHKLKALIYGAMKTGKTTFAGTAPKPLFICSENGLLSIANKQPDFVEIKTLQELKDLYTYLKEEKTDYDTIVIDSLSEISKIIKDNLTMNGTKQMVLRDWGIYADEMMQTVRQIVNLPYHIICIIHSKEMLDEQGNVEFYDLAIDGKAKGEIGRYFDVIGFAHIDKEGNHKINIKGSNKTLCGDRSNIIPKDNTPLDVQEWFKAIAEISTSTEQVLVKEIESKGFTKNPALKKQYEKIDSKINEATPETIEVIQASLRTSISNSKILSDLDKTNLLEYINTFNDR